MGRLSKKSPLGCKGLNGIKEIEIYNIPNDFDQPATICTIRFTFDDVTYAIYGMEVEPPTIEQSVIVVPFRGLTQYIPGRRSSGTLIMNVTINPISHLYDMLNSWVASGKRVDLTYEKDQHQAILSGCYIHSVDFNHTMTTERVHAIITFNCDTITWVD
jgi:hypothetical protein